MQEKHVVQKVRSIITTARKQLQLETSNLACKLTTRGLAKMQN